MSQSKALTSVLLSRVEEQIDLTDRLIARIPADKLEWRPTDESFRMCDLLGHLLECLAGFCAVFHKLEPTRLAHFTELRERDVNRTCGIDVARSRVRGYAGHIRDGFRLLSDDDLLRRLPTVFASEGQSVFMLLLANFEHLINHKHQLFTYLRLLDVRVSSEDLYAFQEV